MTSLPSASSPGSVVADAAALLAHRLERQAGRLDATAAELAGIGPPDWLGPAQAAFGIARAAAVDRVALAAATAHEAVALARRAAALARAEGAGP